MLNEERIKLMTHMAAYEENEGKRNIEIGNYFRSDYISLQVLKSIISATIVFAIVICGYLFYDFETAMKDMYQIDLLAVGKDLLLAYVVFTGVYTLISYLVYSYRYNRARKSLKKYYSRLHMLSEMYTKENRR